MVKNKFGAIYSVDSDGKYSLTEIVFVDYDEAIDDFIIKTGEFKGDTKKEIDLIKTNTNDFLSVPNKIELEEEKNDKSLILFENDYLNEIMDKYDCEESEAILILSNKLIKILFEKDENGNLMTKEDDTELEFSLDDVNSIYNDYNDEEDKEQNYGMDVIDKVISQCLGASVRVQSMNVKITLNPENKEKNEAATKPSDNVFKELDDIKERALSNPPASPASSIDPKKIISETSKKIVGQENTIKVLVNQIYNNQMIIDDVLKDGELDVTELDSRKASILLDGETGTGKTAILKDIAKQLGLPIVIASSTNFSGTGYVGASVTDLLKDLLEQADGDLDMAERGIIVFDEVDKIAFQKNAIAGVDMKEEVQHELLTFIGGGEYEVAKDGYPFGGSVKFNTSKNTFILSGAFTNLREEKIESVKKSSHVMGFSANEEVVKNEYTVTPEDYIRYGLMREFFGRIKVLTSTNSYNIDDFKNILINSKISPLANFEKTVKMYGYKGINYSDEFLNKVAEEGISMKTGARGLQTVMSGILNNMLDGLINGEFDKDKPITLTPELLDNYKKIFTRKF